MDLLGLSLVYISKHRVVLKNGSKRDDALELVALGGSPVLATASTIAGAVFLRTKRVCLRFCAEGYRKRSFSALESQPPELPSQASHRLANPLLCLQQGMFKGSEPYVELPVISTVLKEAIVYLQQPRLHRRTHNIYMHHSTHRRGSTGRRVSAFPPRRIQVPDLRPGGSIAPASLVLFLLGLDSGTHPREGQNLAEYICFWARRPNRAGGGGIRLRAALVLPSSLAR